MTDALTADLGMAYLNPHPDQMLDFTPGPLLIYKPSNRDPTKSNAMKLNLRLKTEWKSVGDKPPFLKDVTGGLFIDMPVPAGTNGDGDPTFAWQDRETLVTAKLGRKDITWLRYGITEYRAVERFKPGSGKVPYVCQPKPTAERPVDPDVARRTITMFHKNATSSTVITYCMDETGGILQLSTPKSRRSIKLDLFEEFDMLTYLEHAHRMFTITGKR